MRSMSVKRSNSVRALNRATGTAGNPAAATATLASSPIKPAIVFHAPRGPEAGSGAESRNWVSLTNDCPVSTTQQAGAKLVLPDIPPRGMNSFDIQYARRTPNSTVPVWNETEFRKLAKALASQLLPVGYNTIVIDGGWAGDTIDEHGRPTPDLDMWPSARGGKGFKPLAGKASIFTYGRSPPSS